MAGDAAPAGAIASSEARGRSVAGMSPRILLAWEGGAGRGHVVTLGRVARAMAGVAQCDAALGWMTHAAEIAPWCTQVFPGVALPYDRAGRAARGAPPNATWADYLHDCGLGDGARLKANVAWWLDTLARRAIDLVVGDYAPCALLAARIAGISALAIGTGYGIPPPGLHQFPVFLPDYAAREADEAAMVATVNAALGPLGLPRLHHLPEIYAGSGAIVRSLPFLDPYAALRDAAAYLPPVASYVPPGAAGAGTRVFCYLSTTELAHAGLVEALVGCGLPLLCYLPGADPAIVAQLRAAGAEVADGPVPVATIAASARLMLNSGQHGTVCMGLGAGLPQVCIPQHLEQLHVARRLAETGAARVIAPRHAPAEAIISTLHAAWHDQAMARRARELAADLAPVLAQDDGPLLRARLMPWLPTAARG